MSGSIPTPARAVPHWALLALWLASGGGCDTRSHGPTVNQGILWTRITPPAAQPCDRPDWRGDSIAFQTTQAGRDRIATSGEDGTDLMIRPAPPFASERGPRWVGPALLVYSSNQLGSEDLWCLDLTANATRRLTAFPGGEWDPAPRPGSPGLAYVESADSLGGRLAFLPDTSAVSLTPLYLTPPGLVASDPSFDPAGDVVYFAARGVGGSSQIWRVAVSGAEPAVPLTTGAAADLSPRVSPDGTRVLFVSNRGGRWGIWTVSPQGEGVALALIDYDGPSAATRHPAWSPSGAEIVLSSDRQGGRALWVLSGLEP